MFNGYGIITNKFDKCFLNESKHISKELIIMKLDYGSSSLVILGGWNPNIFTPAWFDKYFPYTRDPNDPEQKKTNIDIQSGDIMSIRHAHMNVSLYEDVIINFSDGKLDFRLRGDGKDLELLEKISLRLFGYLPSTPVFGYGANFIFLVDEINQQIEDVVMANGLSKNQYFDNEKVRFQQYLFGINEDNLNINIGIDINNIQQKCVFKFNFHFNITDLEQFKIKLSDYPIAMLKNKSVQIMQDIYGLKVED